MANCVEVQGFKGLYLLRLGGKGGIGNGSIYSMCSKSINHLRFNNQTKLGGGESRYSIKELTHMHFR